MLVLREILAGIPLISRPFQPLAERLGISEADVLNDIQNLLERGVIKRFGLVVRHRAAGFAYNAMVVWQVPEDRIRGAGAILAELSYIRLCYQRTTHDQWPFNLYCMIHGQNRERVLQQVENATDAAELRDFPRQVLFSTAEHKQSAGMYIGAEPTNGLDHAQ